MTDVCVKQSNDTRLNVRRHALFTHARKSLMFPILSSVPSIPTIRSESQLNLQSDLARESDHGSCPRYLPRPLHSQSRATHPPLVGPFDTGTEKRLIPRDDWCNTIARGPQSSSPRHLFPAGTTPSLLLDHLDLSDICWLSGA